LERVQADRLVVGRAAPVLSRARLTLVALGVGLAAYYAGSESLWSAGTWWDIAFLALVVIPAVFGLVWFALPAWGSRGTAVVGLAFAAAAVALSVADLDIAANFAKLGAMTFLAFWFLSFFETVAWVALVAVVIPWVDAWSVWRGPTKDIVTNREELFGTLSIAFPVPGEHGAANLGLPDLLFFALFLAAAVRFRLRPRLSWLLMALSFGATLALAVWLDLAGLPALPLLSAAFFLANGDLVWRRLREDEPTDEAPLDAGRRTREEQRPAEPEVAEPEPVEREPAEPEPAEHRPARQVGTDS
jgi:hypothetical protein